MFNLNKALEVALTGGICLLTGVHSGIRKKIAIVRCVEKEILDGVILLCDRWMRGINNAGK